MGVIGKLAITFNLQLLAWMFSLANGVDTVQASLVLIGAVIGAVTMALFD